MNNKELEMFINTIRIQDEYIWVKPICDFFEISYENTTRKISKDQILANQSTKKSNSSLFGDNYHRVLLTKKGFIRWIQLINPNTIKEELREKFIQYQILIFDFLFGSMEENRHAKTLYARLKKLKRLKGKITSEITVVKKQLEVHWDNKYLQTSMNFNQLEN